MGHYPQPTASVSPDGLGQQADQIFNAFFTTKPQGTGMGLRISHSLMESHEAAYPEKRN
jgi:signal transduction histidine kinase